MIRSSFLGFVAAGAVASAAHAATVSVITANGPEATRDWVVADPDFGDYMINVSGGNYATASGTPNYHYRGSSGSGQNNALITITVSGLNPNAVITALQLNTTRIAPSVGSGSNWLFEIALSGTDVDTTLPVTDFRTLQSPTSTLSPAMRVEGSFGNAPAFAFSLVELEPYSTRTVGFQNITITASPIPEPASLGLLTLGGMLSLRRRR
jgi:hypothetical protein